MTNREAIDVVKVLKAVCEETFGEGEVEALQMAIDALEKHETTADTDTVSRQAVIDTVRKIILGFFSDEDGVMNDTEKTLLSVSKAVCNGVRELPSAQPEVLACGEGELIAQPEIVRCKDCTFYRSDGCFFSTAEIEEDGFCSWAERKTDG